jgi:sulfur carrier protein ThiS
MIRVDEKTLPWHAEMTVADLLRKLGDTHPYPVVRINTRYISRPNFEKTMIPDEADIYLVPMIAGG